MIALFWGMMFAHVAMAVPAKKGTVQVKQPDGTTVTVSLHGDEWLHYETTDDGYTVVKDTRGYYVYAEKRAGQLLPTAVVAHDAVRRDAQETGYLQQVTKYLRPDISARTKEVREKVRADQRKTANRRRAARKEQTGEVNYRSLAILVQFNDKQFSRSDYGSLMDDMFNKENYDGYPSSNGWGKEYCTGSVRDYFVDNSGGTFSPQFDVFGPYTINYSQYDAKGTENAATLINAAVNAADADIDFSLYDNDGDNTVDNIYFIFAGYGANFGGNDQRLFWPHRSYVYDPVSYDWVVKDGVYLADYASSVELYGYKDFPSTVYIDGIGTICHEFSHVLGLPDFYDTDYEKSGGESNHPGDWSVMSGGSYLNNGRTPVNYSLLERTFVGFCDEPPTLTETGSYTLEKINQTNTGFVIETPDENEVFLLENRQQEKWDAYLPGHGMLVFRADNSNIDVWQNNTVNANPAHQYYELLRARPGDGSTDGDPFPGTGRVTMLDNSTSPANLITWSGMENPFGLENIKEKNGVITFDLINALEVRSVSLPETLKLCVGMSRTMKLTVVPSHAPYTLTWTSDNPDVVTVDEFGVITGIAEGTATVTGVVNDQFVVSSVVTVEELKKAADIAAFKSSEQQQEAMLTLTDAQVVFVNGKNYHVRDHSGVIVFTSPTASWKVNDMLNGEIYGQLAVDGKTAVFQQVEDLTNYAEVAVTTGETAQPRVVEVSELTDADMGDYIKVEKVELAVESDGDFRAAVIQNSEKKVALYNRYGIKGIKLPAELSDKLFDVTGIFGSRMLTLGGEPLDDIYFTETMVITDKPEVIDGIAAVDATATEGERLYFTTDGRQVRNADQPGVYIVREGKKVYKVIKR